MRPSISSCLAALEPDRLARAFSLRPELLAPQPPPTIGELAQRVTRPPLVGASLAGCDRWSRQVVEVALVLGGPTSAAAIAALMRTGSGQAPTPAQVQDAIELLADRLLVFLDGDAVWLNSGLVQLIPRPCGLAPPAAALLEPRPVNELREILDTLGVPAAGKKKPDLIASIGASLGDGQTLERILAGAPRPALDVLAGAHAGRVTLPYKAWTYARAPKRSVDPHGWLADRGLIVGQASGYGYGYGQADVPREVGLALRGGAALIGVSPEPPPLATVPAGDPADIDRRGAGRAANTVRLMTRMLGLLEASPAATLKDGGVGPREAGRLAKALEVATPEAFVLLEVAGAAGLVPGASYVPVVPTTDADEWLAAPSADRWVALALGWMDAAGLPSLAGRKDPAGKLVPAFVHLNIDGRSLRRATLELLATAGPGERLAGDVIGAVSWSLPAAVRGLDDIVNDIVPWILAEAAELGVVADGALTTVGRRLLAEDLDGAAAHAATLLVDAPAEVILQADLTAVVDASAPQPLLDELRLLADTESAGSAIVLRFSPASVRRALDAGRDGAEIVAFLAAHATRGVPQPLEYLITDTARRWGSVRIGPGRAYVRSDEPALLAEAVRHRRLAKLGLRLLAPTVAVSPAEPAALLAALRDAGFLPVEEDADGVVLRDAPRRMRAPAPRRAASAADGDAGVDFDLLAKTLLAGGDAPPPTTAGPSGPPGPATLWPSPGGPAAGMPDGGDPEVLRALLAIMGLEGLDESLGIEAAWAVARQMTDPALDRAGPGRGSAELDPHLRQQIDAILAADEFGFEADEFDDCDDEDDEVELEPAEVVARLVPLAKTASVVELLLVDTDGNERAVTGKVLRVDRRPKRIMFEREPDRATLTIDAYDVFAVRVLRDGGGAR